MFFEDKLVWEFDKNSAQGAIFAPKRSF